tara:strand:+ start:162 stop:365 length:204 start_codon:yes stop_codon:yes gene_type:complete
MSDITNLLKEIKAYRNDMVARNYPFQEISNIITRWELKLADEEKTVSEQSQDELEPINTINSPMSDE